MNSIDKWCDNHIRTNARQLLLNLQNLKNLGATADQLRQTGLETLKRLETTSMLMIHDFEHFQVGNIELEHRYSVFDANAAAPATTLNWAAYSDAPVQNPLMGAIGQYMVKPPVEQPSVLASVIQRVQRAAANNVDMEAKKVQNSKVALAKVIQEDDASLVFALASATEGLSAEQKREVLMNVVPNAPVGKLVNAVAAPLAAISTAARVVIGTAVKGAVLSGIAEHCQASDPANHDQCVNQLLTAFEGRDPKFNEVVKDAMPSAVLSTVEFFENVEGTFHKVDNYMERNYYTAPGIVQGAIDGGVDVGLAIVTVGTATAVKRGVQATVQLAKPIIHGIRDVREVTRITRAIVRPLAGESLEAPAVFGNRMQAVVPQMRNYSSRRIICGDLAEYKIN